MLVGFCCKTQTRNALTVDKTGFCVTPAYNTPPSAAAHLHLKGQAQNGAFG